MESFEPKKLALIRVLQILERNSDFEHPIKHDKIVELLESEYGLVIERKAIGRNISLLNEAGYEIETRETTAYSLMTAYYYNCFTSNMLSQTPYLL